MDREIMNIGILAHVDAGKTTVTEQLLYLCGSVRQAGRVDRGTARTDYMEVERRRGISVKTATAPLSCRGCTINLIDTPGHVDFIGEVERSLSILDGAVLVVSAVDGVQAQTALLRQALQSLGIPVLILINKIDQAGSRAEDTASQLERELPGRCLVTQRITGEGSERCAVSVRSAGETDYADEVLLHAADFDETIGAQFLRGGDISPQLLEEALPRMTRSGWLTPVLFSCAKTGAGMPELLDGLLRFLPRASADDDAPLSGVVYKVSHDRDMGKAAHIRLFGGRLKSRDEVRLQGGSVAGKITQIRRFSGDKTSDTGELSCGDIGAVYGLAGIKTGDVIGQAEPHRKYTLAAALLRVQVFPEEPAQRPALAEALLQLSDEDPLLDLQNGTDGQGLHLNITGKIQLEILAEQLGERYGLRAAFSEPTVIYRETPAGPGIGFESYTMPKPCWAVVRLKIEPLPPGSGLVFESVIKEGVLPYRYQNHVRTSALETARQGLYGWEISDAKITLVGGEHHHVHTHPLDFFVATPIALLRALTDAGSQLLEPVCEVTLSAAEGLLGRVIGDILAMRGRFDSPVIRGTDFTLTAMLPMASSLDYPESFAIATSGKGTYASRFAGFEPCAPELGATCPRRGVNPLDRSKWILHCRSALAQ